MNSTKERLYSIPVRFGVASALQLSSFFHACTVVFFAAVGLSAQLGVIYWSGLVIVAIILFWEHRLVTPTDLSRINKAFFDLNAYVSIGYLLTTVADLSSSPAPGSDNEPYAHRQPGLGWHHRRVFPACWVSVEEW